MLYLTRKLNQSIMIGDEVEVKVVQIMGKHVELGISAPPQVPVHRQELFLSLKLANNASARTSFFNFQKVVEGLQKKQSDPKGERSSGSN